MQINPDFFDETRVSHNDQVYYLIRMAVLRAGALPGPDDPVLCRELAMSNPDDAVNRAGNIVQYILAYEGPPPARNDSDYRSPRGYT